MIETIVFPVLDGAWPCKQKTNVIQLDLLGIGLQYIDTEVKKGVSGEVLLVGKKDHRGFLFFSYHSTSGR